MKLSARGRHSMEAMFDLAIHYGEGPILIRDIAMRRRISEQYLAQLFIPLRIAGLVRSVRGANGGFVLAKEPSEIRLSEVVRATEGSTAPSECVDDARVCWKGEHCVTRQVWAQIKQATDGILDSLTLADMVERWRQSGVPEVPEEEGLLSA
ncbi:RrF2 family transcriptional regulator [Dehalogenimonas alkenigignens]|uniref:Transcriptional regulator n=1 Tax=Dehalogenimonas alkenigignens TaxID=1217799 RepID=A0A0W0GL48_9CHLR|nr:Rrf2 family transcriptional regulator [Dehalogenimonas alkenigignens]KTB49256.1 transcriptional regulator [Dehalogenimonas alkenigignens]PVV83757.1 Rrf2 family transcriptional regulator [Dehalogenimonas alkenigignens]